jgi:TP901 family phage tail tape measure protein
VAEVVKGIVDIEINTGKSAAELKILQQQINSVFLSLNKNNAASLAASQKYASSLADMINSSKVFTAESVRMRTAAGALDDTLKKGQATLGQYFSAKYVKNGALFAETLDLARQKASVLQTQFIATAKSSKGMQDALAIRPLQAFADQATIASQRTQILSSMFRQGTTQLVNFGKNVQWAGRQLMVGFTVPLTIFGTTAGRVFADLEKQTVAFKKVYGDLFTTPKEMQSNLQAVQDLGREYTKYGIAVKDTMSLAAQAAAAGRRNSDLTDAVTQATRLATLGQMDQNAALETTIALQSAFKLSGNELADTINYLNMVENQTVVSLQDIAAAIPRVAPVIQGLGGDVKDLTVFLAAMQEGGVSAEQGANALKSGLASLINPSKSATETLGKFGVNLDAIIQTNQGDLMKTVTAFAKALSTLGEFEQQQALEEVFGKYQYARLGALFENVIRDGSQAQQVMATMGYSVEDLAMTADRELKTIEEAFSVQLKAAVEKFKLAIAPIGEIFVKLAIPLVNFATSIADAFNGLPDFSKKFIAFATIITGLVIPAGTMFFGLLMNLTGTLAKLFQFMGAFSKGFLQGGIVGAFKNATQSTKYFSTAEIEAALAAQQLGTATEFTNSALRKQVSEAMGAAGAVKYLGDSYTILIAKMMEAARLAPYTMGVGQTAAGLAQTGRAASGRIIRPPQMRNSGGRIFMSNGSTVPGTGNSDTVPAMLTPGEFIVNKQATEKNLGLLYAINGGGAGYNKGGTTYANPGAYLGPVQAAERAAAELAAFAPNRRRMPVGTASVAQQANNQLLGKLNNLVYLVNPTTNKQLIGNRIMGGFDKRGVPLDQLKREMTSDVGMWMIDAYAGKKWAKTAYKTTLQNNFDSIAAKYPGKEVRFLDSKGFERIKDVMDRPEYNNVKFVSVKELQNQALFNRLSPDHLQRLLSEDTANIMKQRMRSSTGQMANRSTYEDLNSNSYTKMQQSWRGTKRPAGFEGAHMYGMGGKIDIQKLNKGGLKYLVGSRQVRSKPNTQKLNLVKNDPRIKNLVNRFLDKEFDQIFEGMLLNDAIVLRQKKLSQEGIIKHLKRYNPNNPNQYREALSQFLIEKGRLRGSLAKRQNAASPEFRKETLDMLIESGLISRTSRNLVDYDRGHHESFTAHRAKSTVREGYMGQAAFDDTNQLYRILQTKGINIGDTASTPGELAFQQKKLREELGLGDFQYLNKGGMIPRFGLGGLRGKAIFERGKAGVPKIMNLSGLAKNGENVVIDLVRGGMNVDDAIKFAKLTQTGQLRTGIPTGPVRDIEDYIKRKIDFEKSQGSMTNELYRKYYGIRNKPIAEQQKIIDNYNKLYWGDMGPAMYNKGGVAKYNRGNIVPGSGNTDTVPAMLTPGEFVVNKEATRNNMALLKAINNGSMAGYNKGGKIPGVQYFATDEQNRLVMDLATNNRGVAGPTSSLKPSMQSRVSGYMARNPAMGMGLMSAGFVLPMIGQQMQQATNKYVNGIGSFINTLTPAILAMSIFPSLIPKLFGPWGILIAAVTATAIGLKKYRESIDKAARESAKQGASAGGAANALDVMAKILGKQTPLQISLSNSVKFTDKQLQAQEESFAALQTEQGQAFLQNLRGMSSTERSSELSSYIQNAIASGMMDATSGGEFARVVGVELKDSLLSNQVIRQISSQGSGSEALLRLTQQRGQYKGSMEGPARTAISAGRGGTYTIGNQDFKDSSFNISSAIQTFKSAEETQALANIELQKGAITQSKYNEIIEKTNSLQQEAQKQIQFSLNATSDKGATAQALKDQLILGGYTEEQVKKINEISNKLDEGKSAQVLLQVSSGQIRPEDLVMLVDFIQNKDNSVAVEWANKFVGNEIEASKFAMWAQNNLSSSNAASFKAAVDIVGLDKAGQLQELLYSFGFDKNGNLALGGSKLLLEIETGNKDAIKEFSDIYKNMGSGKPGQMKQAAIDFAIKIGGSESSFDYVLNKIKDFNNLTLENKFASITYAVQIADTQGRIAQAGKNISLSGAVSAYNLIDQLNKDLLAMNQQTTPTSTGGTGEKTEIQMMQERIKQTKQYIAALKILNSDKKQSMLTDAQIAQMDPALAIEIANKAQKQRISLEKAYQDYLKNTVDITNRLTSAEDKRMQVLDIQDKIYNRQITLIDRRINAKQDEIEKEQDLNEVRQHALDQITEQENTINEAYGKRIEALDKVDNANQRNANRQKSRINLATALTSGDIGAAAQAAAEITAQEAQYKLEDARAALELQRENAIKAIKVSVNGVLMTRKEIEDAIKLSNEKIYQIGLDIKKIESEKIPILQLQQKLADERYALELKSLANNTANLDVYRQIFAELQKIGQASGVSFSGGGSGGASNTGSEAPLAQQDKYKNRANQITNAINSQLKGSTKNAALSDFNRFINNSANKVLSEGERDLLISRYKLKINPPLYAMGGMVNYKGSKEAPPAVKMAYGSLVPGMGNTDRVPALLTPGEFVIRKSVASAYMPLLEQLNGNVYPGGAMPKGSAKNNSNLYNNSYSINVNVAGTDASPDEIANAVMSKIKQVESRSLRGVRVG